jgi:hypothetical protein
VRVRGWDSPEEDHLGKEKGILEGKRRWKGKDT